MVIYQLNISECTQNIKVPKKSLSIYKIDVEKRIYMFFTKKQQCIVFIPNSYTFTNDVSMLIC